ncbi:MAG TPA: ATP-binding protein [Gemmatimonadales bacterium]|jgi:two-component system NtrC family sensor kinase
MERLSADTFRLVLDTMVEGVVLHDASGDVVWCNPSAARILGPDVLLSVRTSGSHEQPLRAIREDGSEFEFDDLPVMVVLRTNRPQRDVVMGLERERGQRLWVSVNAEPIVHIRDGRTAVVASYADITAERESAVRMRTLENQLRQAQKMEAIGQLTGGIAHDFNNLLTAILTNADLLAEVVDEGPPDAREELSDLRRAARRGADLVRKLMVFARRDRPELTHVDVADLLWDSTRLLRRLLPESIELSTQVERGLPAILADPAALEQVLLNLSTNARDAMPEGGVLRIQAQLVTMGQEECRALQWGMPGPVISITVIDDGQGMDAKTLEKIYDPFFTTKPVGAGTGLGMSIVYGVMQQHEAYIGIESAPGKGTRVELRFPPAATPMPMESEEDTADVAGGTETILLVEDNEGVRAAARRILERRGYKVISATTGEDALQLYQIQGHEIALVLADVIMPQMGGIELVSTLKRQGSKARMLLTSGYTQRAADVAAMDVPLLPKPWTPNQLARRVRETLDNVGAP